MRILLLGFSKIKYMPYANFYLQSIDCNRHDVHFLYWNRDLKPEDTSKLGNITLHEFCAEQKDQANRLSKIKSFLAYRQYAKKVLKADSYDFIIILHTMPGILLSDILKKSYKDKFVFDYRDSTYERVGIFKRWIGNVITASRYTFTSSDGFCRFFPESEKEKIYISHNLSKEDLLHRNYQKNPSERIRIAFWGFIRGEALNRKIIERVAADPRFELHYYGREQQVALNLKEYAANISAKNIYFHGEYIPSDRYEFIRETDMIHNMYGDTNAMLAMGNKYYDGMVFYIPQICMSGSHMGQLAAKNGIGFQCDPADENFTQNIYDYYQGIDMECFARKCNGELQRILNEYQRGEDILKKIFCYC